MSSSSNTSKEAIIDFTSGSIAGLCCAYVGQPLDTIKVKIQTYPQLYNNALRCALDTVKREGFLRLWAGVSPAIAANIAENSILFLCYGQCTKVVAYGFGTDKDKMTTFQKACAGSFAGFFCTFALCPLELIKCRMQTLREFRGTHENIKPFTIIKDVMQREGLRGFYRGISSTILREVPGYFFFFGGYEGARYYFAGPGKSPDEIGILSFFASICVLLRGAVCLPHSGVLKTILAGGIGGVLLWSVAYPIDTAKSRIQVYSAGGQDVGFIEVCQKLSKEGGMAAFYRGITPTLVRAFIANAALFVGYEYSKKMLGSVT